MLLLFVLFTFMMGAKAAVYIEGPCPDLKPVENFELSSLTGKWYQIARYQNEFENGTCVVVTLQNENDAYKLEINDYSSQTPKRIQAYVDFAPNAPNTGFLTLNASKFNETEGYVVLPMNIVDIDSDQYFIAYECKYIESKKKNHVYAFVDARTPTLTADAKAKIDNFIKSSTYIDNHHFLWDHFDPASCGKNI